MMNKVKVGVVGYGTIGQRLADGVVRMGDMELVGVANRTPNLGVRALKEKGMPYDLYMSDPKYADAYAEAGVPVCGTMEDLAWASRASSRAAKRTTSLTYSSTVMRTTKRVWISSSSS